MVRGIRPSLVPPSPRLPVVSISPPEMGIDLSTPRPPFPRICQSMCVTWPEVSSPSAPFPPSLPMRLDFGLCVDVSQSQRRVVVTGMGIVSCLGNTVDDVKESLHSCKSGIRFNEKYVEIGMKSHVCGTPDINTDDFIDRKQGRFMGSEFSLPETPNSVHC